MKLSISPAWSIPGTRAIYNTRQNLSSVSCLTEIQALNKIPWKIFTTELFACFCFQWNIICMGISDHLKEILKAAALGWCWTGLPPCHQECRVTRDGCGASPSCFKSLLNSRARQYSPSYKEEGWSLFHVLSKGPEVDGHKNSTKGGVAHGGWKRCTGRSWKPYPPHSSDGLKTLLLWAVRKGPLKSSVFTWKHAYKRHKWAPLLHFSECHVL